MDNTPSSAPYHSGHPADEHGQPSVPAQRPASGSLSSDQPWNGLPEHQTLPFAPEETAVEGEVVDGELTGGSAPGEVIRAEVISTGLDAPTQVVSSSPQVVDTGQMPYAGAGYPHAPGAYPPADTVAVPAPPAPYSAPAAPYSAPPAPYSAPAAPYSAPPASSAPPVQYPLAQYPPAPYPQAPYPPAPYAPAQYAPQPVTGPPWSPPGQPPPWGTPAGPASPPAPPYPGYPPPYYLPEPPRRNRRGLIVGGVIAAFVVLALCAGLIGYGLPSLLGSDDPSTSATPSAAASGSTPSLPADATDDQIVQATLDAQSAALLRGDQAGFLAPVDAAASSAVTAYKRLYHNLIQMHVKVWKTASSSLVDLSGTSKHTFTMSIEYCFNSTGCDGVRASMKVTAEKKDGKVLFEGLAAPKASGLTNQPLPWEVTTLTAVVGNRVVLAASSAWASRLPKVLPIAESAAAAADKYAKWGAPTNYVIYLASSIEGKTWFDGGLKNADGVSYTISPKDIQMVIMMPYATEQAYAGPGVINTVIQHEMGHVVTLWAMNSRSIGHDDFIEGIAEYIAYNGHSSWAKYRIYDTRAYIRSGKWSSRKCYLTDQIVSSNVLTSSAAYGIGYLTMKYLATKYGQDKMLTFWGAHERDGVSLDAAAKQAFGTSWSSVNSSCATYVRHAVGA